MDFRKEQSMANITLLSIFPSLASLSTLQFAYPWILLFWPVPFLIWFYTTPKKIQTNSALRVPFFQTIIQVSQSLQKNNSLRLLFKKAFYILLWLIWSLFLLGLATPQSTGIQLPTTQDGRNIMMVLDVSGSMSLPDHMINNRPTDRLTIVKRAAKQFVHHRSNDQLGLILFGSRAYLWTPLTYDHANIIERIEDASVGLAGQETAIGDAIGLAIKHLNKTNPKGRVMILLTDGVNNGGILPPIKAAELAKQNHIKIYTIGLGPDQQLNGFSGLFLQANSATDLDEATLKQIAEITQGQYFRASDLQSLETIYNQINQIEQIKQKALPIIPKIEWYPVFLIPAVIFLFILLGYILLHNQHGLNIRKIFINWRKI